MKKNILPILGALLALPLIAADPKDDVNAAAKSLAGKANYTWVSTPKATGGFGGGIVTGKTEKAGYTLLSSVNNDVTTEAALKGTNGVIKTAEGWKTLAEMPAPARGGGAGGRGGGAGRQLLNTKAPYDTLTNILAKVKEMKKGDADSITGDLSEAGAGELLTFRGGGARAGGNPPPAPTDAKGSLKVWLKAGDLTKYELTLTGKFSFGGQDRDIDRTTTVEIKDAGTTKVEVPAEAKKKLDDAAK